jgi:cytochrome c
MIEFLTAQATPEPGMMFDPTDRLAQPPMSDPLTQVELGHYAYCLSCMVCHGDQGLNDEWRGALDPADQNFWQFRCRAANHPSQGFELPRYAPPVIGTGVLTRFQTAAELYDFLRSRMPWQAPGILSDDEYWQLTAFLLDANGLPPGNTTLRPDNAGEVDLAYGTLRACHQLWTVKR